MEQQYSTDLRALQLSELEILLEFQRICQKHDLQYFLTAGTLLGAVRHKGFIPWDDDIDVMMLRPDFERFKVVCRDELDEAYFYQDEETDPNYPFYFAKLRKNGTKVIEPMLKDIAMHSGQYIDIFPLDGCPDWNCIARLYFKGMELLNCAILSHTTIMFTCGYTKWYMKLIYHVLSNVPIEILRYGRHLLRKLANKVSSGKRLCTVGGQHGFPKETFQSKWLQHTLMIEFEKKFFSVPSGWNEILHNMYGNYHVFPSEEGRKGHFDN